MTLGEERFTSNTMQRFEGDRSLREAIQSDRQAMVDLLTEEELTSMEISQALGISEKDVVFHLEHIRRTLGSRGRKLQVKPFSCLSCGYLFKERTRLSRPGRCPRCKKSHIRMALFSVL